MQLTTFIQSRLKTFSKSPLRTLLFVVLMIAATQALVNSSTAVTILETMGALLLAALSIRRQK